MVVRIANGEQAIVYNLEPHWRELIDGAKEIVNNKTREGTISYQALIPNRRLLGIMGEQAFELASGVPRHRGYQQSGNGGVDFPGGVQVRAIQPKYQWTGNLIAHDEELEVARVFHCCVADIENKVAWFLGTAYRKDFDLMERRVFRKEMGPQLGIPVKRLRPFNVKAR